MFKKIFSQILRCSKGSFYPRHILSYMGHSSTFFRSVAQGPKVQADVDVALAQDRHGDVHWASSKGLGRTLLVLGDYYEGYDIVCV